MKRCFAGLLAVLPLAVSAQTSQEASEPLIHPSWQVGLGIVTTNQGYVGQGTRVIPVPLLIYDGKYLFADGFEFGAHIFKDSGFTFDAIISPGFNEINEDQFSRRDLIRRGINRDDLQDRKLSVYAGFTTAWSGNIGEFRLTAEADISGNSEGEVYNYQYTYPFQWAGFTISPSIGADFLSNKTANYYYGIHAVEVRRGAPAYEPGGSLLPYVSINLARPLGEKWKMLVGAKYYQQPDRISNSPLMQDDHGTSVFFGVVRSF